MTRSVLAVGAYPGDLELACAGALGAHRAAGDSVTMLVLSCAGPDDPSTRRAEEAAKVLDCLLVWGPDAAERRHRDRRTNSRSGSERRQRSGPPPVTAAIENVLTGVDADVIYTHAPADSDPQRRAAAEATIAAARHSSRILHYAGETTLSFEPSLYVDITAHLTGKLSVTADPDLATTAARTAGARARVQYAEGFAPDRFLWDLSRDWS